AVARKQSSGHLLSAPLLPLFSERHLLSVAHSDSDEWTPSIVPSLKHRRLSSGTMDALAAPPSRQRSYQPRRHSPHPGSAASTNPSVAMETRVTAPGDLPMGHKRSDSVG